MFEDKSTRRPVIDPLLLALKSRRVMVALSALIVGLLTLAVPEIEAVRGEVLTLLITLALALIGGYSVEDAARAGRARADQPPSEDTLRQLVKDVLDGLVDEIGDKRLPPNQRSG